MAPTKKKKPAAKAAPKPPPQKAAAKAKPNLKKLAKNVAKKVSKKVAKVAQTVQKATAAAPKLVKKNSSATVPAKRAAPLRPNMITPLDDRLVVEVEEAPATTAGGIIIPDTATDRPNRGTVMAKGPGRRNRKGLLRPLDVNVGDIVLFPYYAGQKIQIDGREFLILREEELLAIALG